MTLTKTLQQLLERAERKGTAVKRVREGSIMGNSYGNSEWVKTTPMTNQWEVNNYIINGDTSVVEVLHYDTLIAKLTKQPCENWKMVYWYGQSNSDRDALNGLCSHFGINRSFRYLPSKDQFVEVAK